MWLVKKGSNTTASYAVHMTGMATNLNRQKNYHSKTSSLGKCEHNESVKPISLNQLSSHIRHKTSPIPRWSKISTTTRSPTYQNKDLMDKQNVIDSPECWCQKIILERPLIEHHSDEFSCSSTYSRLKKKTGHVNHLQWAEHNQLGKSHSEFYKHSCQCEAFHTGQE
jgi:hypothetical protein